MQSLKTLSTFSLPATCRDLVSFTHIDALKRCLRACPQPHLVLGGGSNTIFVEDFAGTILRNEILGIEYVETETAHCLRVGAGESWHKLVSTCCQHGWHSMENLALIPGTVGAAPIQNIGAYGVEVARFIASVEGIDSHTGEVIIWQNADCHFGYRDSIFKHQWRGRAIITHVNFALPKHAGVISHYAELSALKTPSAYEVMNEVIRIRQAKLPDPAQLGNAGSFFKNPVIAMQHFEKLVQLYPHLPSYIVDSEHVKVPAAWLIDQLGFKGQRRGGVGCHVTQPLVLVNHGGGTGQELIGFAKEIVEAVAKTFTIDLEVEVQLIGADGVITL